MLYLTAAALVGALAVRLCRGDGLRNLPTIRCAPLAVAAWLLQLALFVSPLAGVLAAWGQPIHFVSLGMLGVCVMANWQAPGVSLLALGMLLNIIVMATNTGFMPVSPSGRQAVLGADTALSDPGVRTEKTFLMRADTPLWFLGDVVPVALLGKIYSVGDLIAGVGAFVLVSRRTPREDRALA